ncbi:MAG: hypothetical protein Q4E99_03875, partial [Bacillota bacterium]|nr:hypothetical protein [Bacillota bacterium]
VGTLSNPSLLPDPETTPRNNAYVVKTASYNRLYFIAGEDTLAWDYVEMGSVGTTITEDNRTHEIAVLDIQDLIPDGMQIIGTDVVADNDYGLIVTGNIEDGVRSEMKSTENAGAYTIPIKDSDTIKIDVANSKFTLNLDADLTSKIGKALVHPNSAPTKTKLVGVDTSNAQTLIDADTYLPKTFNAEQTLKNTGGTIPLRLESNANDCWLRFWGSNGQIGELGGNASNKRPMWWDTIKSYKICLDDNTFTKRDAQNSMKLGDMIINFGNVGSYAAGSGLATINLTFKTAFTNSNYWLMAVPDGDTSDSPQSYDYTGMVKISNRSNTGCTLSVNFVAGHKRGISYIAIGK